MKRAKITVYTDGSCLQNNDGGWAAAIFSGKERIDLIGAERNTTNNRMELLAVVNCFTKIPIACTVTIFTDSTYVKDGFTKWVRKWQRTGWKNHQGREVKNRDLWEQLLALKKQYTIHIRWIKGHNGHVYNEQVDKMARKAAQELSKQPTKKSAKLTPKNNNEIEQRDPLKIGGKIVPPKAEDIPLPKLVTKLSSSVRKMLHRP